MYCKHVYVFFYFILVRRFNSYLLKLWKNTKETVIYINIAAGENPENNDHYVNLSTN